MGDRVIRLLKPDTGWRWVVIFMSGVLHPWLREGQVSIRKGVG